jgi:serine/threonine protein kinase/WD40 repeat protein
MRLALLSGLPPAQADPPTALAPALEQFGAQIGRYKLLQKIGEGGCGTVYMAEQEEPVRRRVALKVIKLGMDSKQVVARFEAEGQALALMDHPNIAKIFDAGVVGSAESQISNRKSPIPGGRPYFVMELVRGVRITQYCDQHNLSTTERLDLFIQVCQAIQHAHQKGIIHRDIKPSNVLVTVNDGMPVPKVIDFGIAKATEQRLTDKTLFTEFQAFLGTPAYMSPEQAEMTSLDIDTRSDIYGLGVLLYELLTGRTPFDGQELLKAGFDEMRRIIREKEPMRPSTRLGTLLKEELSTTAQHRRTEMPKLIHLVRGDLDWIVMKCLDKDRTRRYETANGLASDLKRHLNQEPVLARPPSTAYRVQKFVRRNKGPVAATVALAFVLAAGAVVSAWQWRKAVMAQRGQEKQRKVAERAKTEADQQRDVAIKERQRAKDELREAYLAQARMNRALAAPGCRSRNLEVLLQAAQIRPGLDLRNEAVATLSLLDLRDLRPPLSLSYVRFDADMRHYVTRDTNGNVTVREMLTDRDVLFFPSPGRRPAQMRFSPDNRFLAIHYEEVLGRAYTGDDLVRVWALPRCWPLWGTPKAAPPAQAVSPPADLQPIEIHYRDNNDLTEFTPDSQQLVLGSRNGSLHFYDLKTGQRFKTLAGQPAETGRLALSPTGSRFAEWSSYSVVVRDMSDGRQVTLPLKHPAGLHQVAAVAWHSDGKHLAVASGPQIHLWDVDAQVELVTIVGHRDEVSTVEFNHAGTLLASSSLDGTTRLWDPFVGKQVFAGRGAGYHLKFSRHDQWLSFNSVADHTVVFWEMASNTVVRTLHKHEQDFGPLQATSVTAGGQLVAQELQGELKLWHLNSGREMASLPLRDNEQAWLGDKTGNFYLRGPRGLIRWPVRPLSPSGELCIGPPEIIDRARFNSVVETSGDGHRIAVTCQNHCHIFDSDRRTEIAQTGYHRGMAFAALTFDGQRLATGTLSERGVRVWQTRTGRLERELPAEGACAVLFSPDGRWLLAGTSAEYCLWDAVSWTPRLRAARVTQPNVLETMAFSPDARVLAVTSTVSSVRLLDVASGQELVTLEAPEPWPISWLGFTPDGAQLVVAGGTRFIHVWDLRLLRQQLAAMDLDWEHPALPPAAAGPEVRRVIVRTSDPTPAPVLSIDLTQKIPPRDPRSGAHLIDLAPYYNAALAEEWHRPGWTNGFACVPLGLQNLDGVEFDLRGVIQLVDPGKQSRSILPASIRGLKVGRLCQRLHFLHSSSGTEVDGAQIGRYVIHYVGGATREVPIRYGEDVRSWSLKGDSSSHLTHAKVAWTGINTAGLHVRLCHSTWDNPLPSIEIESLDFIGETARADPFLLALTAE